MGQREARQAIVAGFRRAARRFTSSCGGAAALELAIISPVAVMMLMGAWDFGRAFHESSRLANAAYAGAQYAAQDAAHASNLAGIEQAALEDAGRHAAGIIVNASQACECPNGVPIGCGASCGAAGDPQLYVTILVETDYETMFPYPFIENPIRLGRQTVMRAQ